MTWKPLLFLEIKKLDLNIIFPLNMIFYNFNFVKTHHLTKKSLMENFIFLYSASLMNLSLHETTQPIKPFS